MPTQTVTTSTPQTAAETPIIDLYRNLLEAWNSQNAVAFAAQFDESCHVIGFDGSQMNGRAEVESTLSTIFAHHKTATYLAKVREVRFLSPQSAILRAVVGMIPRESSDINPAVNAVQSLVTTCENNQWRIVLFQNTPAQFHGRPDLANALTAELRQLL